MIGSIFPRFLQARQRRWEEADLALTARFADAAKKKSRLEQLPKGVLFRLYEELNDYLPEKARKKDLRFGLNGPTTVRKAIVALNIPAAEVDLILVNGRSARLGHRLRDGDRVSVYPIFERFDISGVTKVRKKPLVKLRLPKK
jgi:hypothetical protein